ncbi:MAG: zinc ribbon domain-containing protein [Candidatus Aenigmarchaeota archaeon]|nr:zinc ribbon domain-containing protein [Candidatus Aenigmarchaeota archaeon]
MACEKCNIDTKDDWSFCPKCGHELKRSKVVDYGMEDVFASMANSLQNMTKRMLFEGMRPQGAKAPSGLTVKIVRGVPATAMRNQSARIAPVQMNAPAKVTTPLKARPAPKKTIEPEATFNKLPGKLMVEVKTPGVESIEDVDVLEMGTSVEVRAYSGDTLYFKIINVPKKASVVSKKVESGKLVLEMKT